MNSSAPFPLSLYLFTYTFLRLLYSNILMARKDESKEKHVKEKRKKWISSKDLEYRRHKLLTTTFLAHQRYEWEIPKTYIQESDVANKIPMNLTHPHYPFYHSLPWMCGWELMEGEWGKENGVGNRGSHFLLFSPPTRLFFSFFLPYSHSSEYLIINLRIIVLKCQHPCCVLMYFLLLISWWFCRMRITWCVELLDDVTSFLPPT